jgi:NTE family protein
VAVVLSGGGAKGVAHISALRAVEEAGIPIDIICGTSMGSLIGALYCIGYTTDELDSLVRSQDWAALLSDRTDPSTLTLRQREEQNTYALIRGLSSEAPEKGGLIRGRNLDRLFRNLCADYLDSMSFDSLPIRFACVATDIVTNNEVDFHDGYLIQAMRASMAIPAAFTPVRMGNMVLIDGGLRNNYPADLARDMGADIIIGVTVQNDSMSADEITDAMSVFNQIIDINSKNKYDENIAMSDIFMKVDVTGYSAASFSPAAIDVLLRRGAEEASRHRDDLLAIRHRIEGSGTISTLETTSSTYAPRHFHERVLDADSEKQVPPVDRNAVVKHDPVVSAGLRFDTEEMGALQVGARLPFGVRWLPMEVSGAVRLGRRFMVNAEYSIFSRRIVSPTVSYTYHNDDLDIYRNGLRTYNIKYRHHEASLVPFNFELMKWQISAGMHWDHYDYFGRLLSIGNDSLPLTDDSYISYQIVGDFNTEDHWYFPSEGWRLHASYSYRTDDFVGMDSKRGLSDILFHMRANIGIAPRLTLQPMLYTRLLAGGDVPLAYCNAGGGEWFGHTVEQQVPLAGIGHVEYLERYLIGGQVQLQYRIRKNHYILLRMALARHNDSFRQLLWPVEEGGDNLPSAWLAPLSGAQIGYSYNTLFGPLDIRLGYSSRTRMAYLFINLGHRF